jgi:exopolyphosphatase/guanosine-5'-triphosphate,3'-diphosphate pyrophosphatase
MKLAIVDIGTNTMLLLIADASPDDYSIKTLADIQRIPRLGKGIDTDRNISNETITKACLVLKEYKEIISLNGAEKIIATATSFLRDSGNKNEFIKTIKKETGIKVELLSGSEEARWTFAGGIYDKLAGASGKKKICTIDIGGGSTEISLAKMPKKHHPDDIYRVANENIKSKSFDFGSVRILERYFKNQPPDKKDISSASDFIKSEFNKIDFDFSDTILIGLAGTITTLSAMKLKLTKFECDKVNNTKLTLDEITGLFNVISSKTTSDLLKMGDYMEGRSDIILSGVLILRSFMELFGFNELTVSTKGLRYGILLRELFVEKDEETIAALASV